MHEKRAPDRQIAEIARRQHGAISVAQLRDAGLSADAVLGRRRSGRLHPLHRGVYAVGHIAPSNERRWMAAVLALEANPSRAGSAAVLSHRSAAELWGLLAPRDGPVDVSLSSRGGKRRRAGIRIHRPVSLKPWEKTCRNRIPATSPTRTLADLRSASSEGELRKAERQANFLGLPTGPDIVHDRTRSELERRFLWLFRRHRLPEPVVNLRIGSLTVDFCWMEERLVVETDGFRAHRGRAAFEDDRERDLRLRTLGYDVMRVSHKQVFETPDRVLTLLRARLTPGVGAR